MQPAIETQPSPDELSMISHALQRVSITPEIDQTYQPMPEWQQGLKFPEDTEPEEPWGKERRVSSVGDPVAAPGIMHLRRVMQRVGRSTFEAIFRQLDTDGSGDLSPDELRLGLTATREVFTEREIRQIMRVADADGGGSVDVGELMALCDVLEVIPGWARASSPCWAKSHARHHPRPLTPTHMKRARRRDQAISSSMDETIHSLAYSPSRRGVASAWSQADEDDPFPGPPDGRGISRSTDASMGFTSRYSHGNDSSIAFPGPPAGRGLSRGSNSSVAFPEPDDTSYFGASHDVSWRGERQMNASRSRMDRPSLGASCSHRRRINTAGSVALVCSVAGGRYLPSRSRRESLATPDRERSRVTRWGGAGQVSPTRHSRPPGDAVVRHLVGRLRSLPDLSNMPARPSQELPYFARRPKTRKPKAMGSAAMRADKHANLVRLAVDAKFLRQSMHMRGY